MGKAVEFLRELGSEIPGMEAIDEFLEKWLSEEDMPYETLRQIEGKLEEIRIRHLKYPLEEILNFSVATYFVVNADTRSIKDVFRSCGIVITQKDMKASDPQSRFMNRLANKYYKKHVRQQIFNILLSVFRTPINAIRVNPTVEGLEQWTDKLPMDILEWIAVSVLKSEELHGLIKSHFTADYFGAVAWRTRMLLCDSGFSTIMDPPIDGEERQYRNASKLAQEKKQLQRKMAKKERETSQLKQAVHQLHEEKKQLKKEIHQLYNEALEEIESLKNDRDALKEGFEEERTFLLETIQSLYNQLSSETDVPAATELTLNGATIAVIGGEKKRYYQEVIEKYGGRVAFVPGGELNLIRGAVSKSEAAFYLSDLTNHTDFRLTLNAAKELKVPFIYVNTKGITTFERELRRFMNNRSVSMEQTG